MSEETQHTENERIDLTATSGEDASVSENLSPIPVIPQLSVALGLLVFVFGVTYIGATAVLTKNERSGEPPVTLPTVPKNNTLASARAFDDVVLEARGAFVWDVSRQRVLFNKNADEEMPLASITKLMTALVAYKLLDPQDTIAISPQTLSVEGDSGFSDGEEFSMRDLADLTLISSSNDGAAALSSKAGTLIDERDPEDVFVHAMNVQAQELGLSKTNFKNSTGLDISESEAGAYGSARDVSLLMEHIITTIPDAVALTNMEVTKISNDEGAYHIAKNTNLVVDEIEGLIASKTGYTILSGGNLVVAVNVGLNRPVIITVLGSSYDGRFDDTLELIERARVLIEGEVI